MSNNPSEAWRHGATCRHSVTTQGPKPGVGYGYARNLCLTRPHLGHTVKRRRWCEMLGSRLFTRAMKRLLIRSNCSGYRGISHQPASGALGLCPTGVKKEPKVNRNPYRYGNVGSTVIDLIGGGRPPTRLGQLRLMR